MYIVTIYSPADKEEHRLTADQEKVSVAVGTLLGAMESSAWFKVERSA